MNLFGRATKCARRRDSLSKPVKCCGGVCDISARPRPVMVTESQSAAFSGFACFLGFVPERGPEDL